MIAFSSAPKLENMSSNYVENFKLKHCTSNDVLKDQISRTEIMIKENSPKPFMALRNSWAAVSALK